METQESQPLVEQVKNLLEQAEASFHRECIVIAGEQHWCTETVSLLNNELDLSHCLIVSNNNLSFSMATNVPMDKALQYLGHEFSHAIINCHDGFDPNVMGAIAGTVRGGGLFILLTPAIEQLQEFDDPETHRMTIWPYKPQDVHHRFLARFENLLKQTGQISLITQQSIRASESTTDTGSIRLDSYLQNDRCATEEQRDAVEAIVHVVDGHRKRPLVITAERGRGKSSALGIAAADLLRRGNQQILVTGPRSSATDKVFEHAAAQVMGTAKNHEIIYKDSIIRYMSVDAIIKENPECSLLMVDEAATIPVNLLTKLLTRYSRIVFSTTTYGYEGTGRGFNLRFFDKLNKTVPGWKHHEIKTPVRWAGRDPLENFMSDLLCLDADIAQLTTPVDASQISLSVINRDDLISDNELLRSIFGLLLLAHYKTQPRDLRYLMDSLDLHVFTARYKGIPVGAALVELEGGLDAEIADKVYRNERRVQGHLLPQSLESAIGIKNASQLRYLRIIRIIAHPHCQRQGIGSKLLSSVEAFARENSVDVIGANFGINSDVLPFWESTGYIPVHVGLSVNSSTGTHALTVLNPLSDAGNQLLESAKQLFIDRFGFLLSTAYKDLDTSIVGYLFAVFSTSNSKSLNDQQIEDVRRFAHTNCDYDMAALSLNHFVQCSLFDPKANQVLDENEKGLLIKKVLQQQSWPSVVSTLKLEGKSQALQRLRETIGKLQKILL